MKNIFLCILLFGLYTTLYAQQLSSPVNLMEVRPAVGKWITKSPVNNMKQRTYRLSSYQTPDGGNGVFLKYDQPAAIVNTPFASASIQIEVEPNPNNGKFTVNISNNHTSVGRLFIYDVLGVIRYNAFSEKIKTFNVDLSNQPEGIYFVSYISDDKVGSARVIKQ